MPSAVLVELYKGRGFDEPVDDQLRRGYIGVMTTGARTARIAGHLLVRVGHGSESAVDALVVATAVRLGGGIILTHDPQDLETLAADFPHIRVVAI